MGSEKTRGFFRAFLDFFILFSGVSTASNLARTQGRPLRTRGLFLFRSRNDAPRTQPAEREESDSCATSRMSRWCRPGRVRWLSIPAQATTARTTPATAEIPCACHRDYNAGSVRMRQNSCARPLICRLACLGKGASIYREQRPDKSAKRRGMGVVGCDEEEGKTAHEFARFAHEQV